MMFNNKDNTLGIPVPITITIINGKQITNKEMIQELIDEDGSIVSLPNENQKVL